MASIPSLRTGSATRLAEPLCDRSLLRSPSMTVVPVSQSEDKPNATADHASYAVESPASRLAALVHTHSTLLFRVAYSILRSTTEAEDVVQETFLRVLQHRETLDSIRDLRVWLIRISWNLALDRKRQPVLHQFPESPISASDADFVARLVAPSVPADQALHHARQLQLVLLHLEKLPRAERHVLLLSAIEELSTAEIAALLGKSESAIRALLFRARTRLRERLHATQSKPSKVAFHEREAQ